jgi:lipopolysaccharide heptosyltransferase II
MERFAAVAQQVSAARAEVQWQLFGAPGEKAMGEQLSTQLGQTPHENLVGKTSLNELIARLKQCRLLLTNDTGTMHLAAALGVPTVSIFGSTCPVATGPLGPRHVVIRHQQPCAPCFDRECRYGHYDCMTKISVDEVSQAVLRALA